MKAEREQLFIKEGVSPEVAKVAAAATFIKPKDRTLAQKEAIHIISERIAANNRALDKTQ
jgi:hypothetical protein